MEGYSIPRLTVEKSTLELRKQIDEVDNLDLSEASKGNVLRLRVVANTKLANTNDKNVVYRKRKMQSASDERVVVGPRKNSSFGAPAAPSTSIGESIVALSSPQQLSCDSSSIPKKRRRVVGVCTDSGTWNPSRRDFSTPNSV